MREALQVFGNDILHFGKVVFRGQCQMDLPCIGDKVQHRAIAEIDCALLGSKRDGETVRPMLAELLQVAACLFGLYGRNCVCHFILPHAVNIDIEPRRLKKNPAFEERG